MKIQDETRCKGHCLKIVKSELEIGRMALSMILNKMSYHKEYTGESSISHHSTVGANVANVKVFCLQTNEQSNGQTDREKAISSQPIKGWGGGGGGGGGPHKKS